MFCQDKHVSPPLHLPKNPTFKMKSRADNKLPQAGLEIGVSHPTKVSL